MLDEIQQTMLDRATVTFNDRVKPVTKWDDVVPTLDGKNIVVLPWCEVEACEDAIKTRSERQ
jgi:prolyl-tRNA synthetase